MFTIHVSLCQNRYFLFRVKLVVPSDGHYGGPQPNGSWTGMLGLIERKEVDFAINAIGITGIFSN